MRELRPFLKRLQKALATPRIHRWAVALAFVLTLPVVFQGFQADDHNLRILVLRLPQAGGFAKSPLELFTFFDGNPARTLWFMDHGTGPFWTDPTLRVAFFRPLSALTHWIDFTLWPTWPGIMHAESVALYLALVALTTTLYRRFLGPTWIAGLASVMFAIDHHHGHVIEWISNRNALLAGVFGLLSLVLHDRARREARSLYGFLSAAALALALLSGEVALGAVAYLVAYGLFMDSERGWARIRSFAPHLVVLVGWLVVYRLGSFGARGSGLYVDPVGNPLRFLKVASRSIPLLLQADLGGIAPDALVFFPRLSALLTLAAVAVVAVSFVAFLPLRTDRRARFFLAGALLAVVPASAAFPTARMTLLTGFGLLGLVAMVVEPVVKGVVETAEKVDRAPIGNRWAAVYTAVWIAGGHVFLSPLELLGSTHQMILLENVIHRFGDSLSDDPSLSRQRVMVVNAPDTFMLGYVASQRSTEGRVAPRALTVLANGTRSVDLYRSDAQTILVRAEGGFYQSGMDLLARSLDSPMPVGTRVEFSDVTIEVTRVNPALVPTEARFHFAVPLEDPSLRWVEWRGPAFVPFPLPAVGQSVHIGARAPSF